MSTHNREELTRAQLKQVTGLARTLHESSEELYKFVGRQHPETFQIAWLIRQTHKRLKEILELLGEEL